MKRKRFAVEQIFAVLKQVKMGMPAADVIRQTGISEQTFYRWKSVRFQMLQEENARLKKLVAELNLAKAILQDINQKNGQARAEVSGPGLLRQAVKTFRFASAL